MSVARVSRNLGFTVPPGMAEEFERLAREEGSTKSELFRRMFRLYQSYRTPPKSRGGTAVAWVERLLAEAQTEERQSPLSDEAFEEGMERAMRYGAERANVIEISSPEDVNDIVYEERYGNRGASRRS